MSRLHLPLFLSFAMYLCAAPPASAQSTIPVPAGGNLQAALNAAQPGDTILLEAGATYVGNFVLPAKAGSGTVTIRSSAPDALLPPEGTRMHPGYAPLLPKLRSPNSASVLATAPGAHHYRLMFLEFQGNANGAGDIIKLGDGSGKQNALEQVPHHLVIDRVYIHGHADLGQKRGIALNSAWTSILNSYISDIKAVGQDSQAICGWNGPGPFHIDDNYLEAAGENVLFGGADPAIPNLVPSDITVTRNHLAKPLSWRGSAWQVKNLFELKSARRVVVDGNLLEYNWIAAQTGYAIVLKSVNQDGGAPWTVVEDVRFTNNIVRHVSAGISILGRDPWHAALEANDITFRNNLFVDISAERYGGTGRFAIIQGGAQITFDHNTIVSDGWTTLYADASPSPGFVFTNNILFDNGLGIKGGAAQEGHGTIAKYFPGGHFAGNVIVAANASGYPSGNFFPSSVDAVGFVDHTGGDYRLSASSAYRYAALDGTAPGCDLAAIDRAMGGGLASAQSAPPPQNPKPPAHTPPSPPSGPSTGAGPSPPTATSPSGAAGTPHDVRATVTGATVTLQWSPPATGQPVRRYLVEAGTLPGATHASFWTADATPRLVVPSVAPGVYHVRLRAETSQGLGTPSPDVQVVVGAAVGCSAPPLPPGSPVATVAGGVVTLTWPSGGGCQATHFVVLAGSASGRADLAEVPVSTTMLQAIAPGGTYHVRVVALNAFGASTPSDEIVVVVP